MKKWISIVFAGALGAVIAMSSFHLIYQDNADQNATPAEVMATSYGNNNSVRTPVTGPDFTVAAEKALKVVVQIQANESDQLAQQRRQERNDQDPFSRFFKDFGFGDDFGFGFGFPNQPRQGAGSGVIISEDGYIVTNNHVVEFADEIQIKDAEGNEYIAQIVGKDPSTDLAVLKIDADNLETLEVANSDDVKIGEWVLAVGNPYRYLTSTVTAGIISAVGRDIDLIRGEKTIEQFIQTDAAINPGNSGGALVDAEGRLLGINTAIASQTGGYAGYSFAIPSNLMVGIVKDIMENGGDIERTHLGVGVLELDKELADELKLDIDTGIYIDEVYDRSPAQYSGILPSDVITEINGKEVNTFDELKEIIDYSKVGDTLKVKVYRNGEHKLIPVRLRKKL